MNRDKAFFVFKITLTIISFIIIIFAKYDSLLNCTLVKEILYDLNIGIFSAMVLIWFIDEINKQIEERKNRHKEAEEILRADRLLRIYMRKYRKFFYCLTTPVYKRNFEKIRIIRNFSLSDMRDMFKPTGLIEEGAYDSSIESFVYAEHELKTQMEVIIKSIDFLYYPKVQEELMRFIEASLKYNRRKIWLRETEIAAGTMANDITCTLYGNPDKLYRLYKNGNMPREKDLIYFFMLFEMLRSQDGILRNYAKAIKEVEQDCCN